jgi:hypothetical protein
MEASSIGLIRSHEAALREYAKGLFELYDPDRDGDDMWTSYGFANGSYADINVYVIGDEYSNTDMRTFKIVAYPVTATGDLVTDEHLLLLEKRISTKHKEK